MAAGPFIVCILYSGYDRSFLHTHTRSVNASEDHLLYAHYGLFPEEYEVKADCFMKIKVRRCISADLF